MFWTGTRYEASTNPVIESNHSSRLGDGLWQVPVDGVEVELGVASIVSDEHHNVVNLINDGFVSG